MTASDELGRTRDAYDAVARDYARLLPALEAETPIDVAMIDDFARRCAAGPPGPVVDAGCGPGRITAYLAARGLAVTGVDLSPGMVRTARELHPDLPFEVGELERLPQADGSAAGVLAWYSLIHTAPDQLAAVAREIARVVAPGGWLLAAFQAGTGEPHAHTSAYGHPVTMTSYRHDPAHVAAALTEAQFALHTRVHRAPYGVEQVPQAILLARHDARLPPETAVHPRPRRR